MKFQVATITKIFIIYLNSFLSCPVGLPVESLDQCDKFSNTTNLCCSIIPNRGESICFTYEKNKNLPTIQKWGVIEYKVNCKTNQSVTPYSNIIPDSTVNNTSEQNSPINIPSFVTEDSSLYGIGFSNCGRLSPKKLEDCSLDSTRKQSCCFYSYTDKNSSINGCYLAGFKSFENRTFKFAFPITCSSVHIKFEIIFLILLSLILILN